MWLGLRAWSCGLGVGLRAWSCGPGVGLQAWSCGLGVDLGLGRVWSTWRASVDLPIGGFFDIIREAKFLASIGPVAQLVRARAS